MLIIINIISIISINDIDDDGIALTTFKYILNMKIQLYFIS